MKKSFYPRAADADEEEALQVLLPHPPIIIPVANVYSFYLSGTILGPERYTDWFNIIRNATENDLIKIHINSEGGQASTAVQFRRVISESDATIVASVEGNCMSAATMIFLACDTVEVSAGSLFMIHNYSAGVVGKGGEMYDQISAYKKWSEKLMHDIYKDFLTEAEIVSVLGNKDIWLDEREVMARLEKKSKAIKKEINKKKQVEKKVPDKKDEAETKASESPAEEGDKSEA